MKAKELKNEDAKQYAWAARKNAFAMSNVYKQNYTDKAKLKVEQIVSVLSMVYANKGVYVNYRKTKAAIKVANARVIDKLALTQLEEQWTAEGVTKTSTAQGIIYSIKK